MYTCTIQAAETWEIEEIFTQIAELRRDNQALRKELSALKQEFFNLKQTQSSDIQSKIDLKEVFDTVSTIGNEDAQLVMMEFTDFQCPYCKKFEMKTFAKLRENFIDTGKVQYVVKDFPLGFHGLATSAAIAANCAGEQENYWGMRHLIFENQRKLNKEQYLQYADKLNLEQKEFKYCLESRWQHKKITQDVELADRLGIKSTPSFLIGRKVGNKLKDIKVIAGAHSYQNFARLLNKFL